MAFVKIPAASALPTAQTDYMKQNAKIEASFLGIDRIQPVDFVNNKIPKGVLINLGGTTFLNDADLSITGTPSNFVKIDHSTLAASFVTGLSGVSWNSTYNGYYSSGGDLYLFDEMTALFNGDIPISRTVAGIVKAAANGINLGNNKRLIPSVSEIGDWNMLSTATKAVPHSLGDDFTKVRGIEVTIFNDAQDKEFSLAGIDYETGAILGGIFWVSSNVVFLGRLAGRTFDSSNFSSLANRGHVTLWYEK